MHKEQQTSGHNTEEIIQPVHRPLPPQQKVKKEGGILSFIVTLIIAFALVQVSNVFLFQRYKVVGSSMFPTLHNSDQLVISKIGHTVAKVKGHVYQPDRGDIIVFVDPIDKNIQLIKRVIGLPGDRVVVKDSKITVYNNKHPGGFNPDSAPYGKDLPPTSGNTDVTVQSKHLFVSGDNRIGGNSLDSRNELGTVPEQNIIGKLSLRIWPLNRTRTF